MLKLRLPFCYITLLLTMMFAANLQAFGSNHCSELTLQFGWFTATQKKHHMNIKGLIGDDFRVHKSSDQNFLVGAGYYFNGFYLAQTRTLLGINAFYLAPTKTHGKVTQEDLFNNLSYHYSRTNYPIYFATKTLFACGCLGDLAIDLGIGPNIVCTSGFKEKSLDGGITVPETHLFSGKKVVVLSATAGLGWRIKDVFKNFSLEINYRFFFLGEGQLEKNNNQVKNNLRTGNSYGNALFFSIIL